MTAELQEEWQYGSRHPDGVDLAVANAIARTRIAKHFLAVITQAHANYRLGNEGVLRGLAKLDQDAHQIRASWSWAAEHRANEAWAAELCRDYSNAGINVVDLRLPPRELMIWRETAVAACRQLGDRRGECSALINLGAVQHNGGNYRDAIELHQRALVIARELGNHPTENAALTNLGNAHWALGDSHKAIECYQEVLASVRDTGDRRSEGVTLANLGIAYKALGDASAAIEFHRQALAIDREFGDYHAEANTVRHSSC